MAQSRDIAEMEHEARRFHGFFAGQFQPEEYEPYIKAGVLQKVWRGTSGFLGLATLEAVYAPQE